jgi:hypothetical protein
MVSLVVVVAAILAVLVLVFSDQPATDQVRRLRGGRPPQPLDPSGSAPAAAQAGPPVIRRGPPPARVLQHQLALPSTRPRTPAHAGAGHGGAPPPPAPVHAAWDEEEVPLDEGLSLWMRMRSGLALLVLLTAVGAVVALAIGVALFLAGLALRHTLR